MADSNRQAGRKTSIPAQALVCLLAIAAPCGMAWAAAPSAGFEPASYIGEFDPNRVWELLLGGIAVVSFLVAIGIWILAALRGAMSAQLRRSTFISSALNTLNQGVMITNAQNRVVFFNDRFLEIYALSRDEIPASMTGRELLELRRSRGLLGITVDEFSKLARSAEGVVTELPDGRSVVSKLFRLPNGGTIGTHEDCTAQRQLSRKLASTTKFLESVLDNVPVCVAAKSIQDGSYKPLSRPLFMYPSEKAMALPEVKAFMDFTVANADKIAEAAKIVPLTSDQITKAKSELSKAEQGAG